MGENNSNDDGLREVDLTQFYGGAMGAEIKLTEEADKEKLKVYIPKYVIPVIFVHGIMGGNLIIKKKGSVALSLPRVKSVMLSTFKKVMI